MAIVSNPVTGPVLGQPISPSFSVQNAGGAPANTAVSPPAGMSLHEAISRGALPRNAQVTAVGAVSTGAQNPTALADLTSNGAGNQCNLGLAVPNTSGNPANTSTLANDPPQSVVAGPSAGATLATGPAADNIETLTSAPISSYTTCGNLTLSGYSG